MLLSIQTILLWALISGSVGSFCIFAYFHRDIDAFEYQKYKDSIKKDFALKNGYTYIEIFYKDINNGNYKKILNKYL